MGLSYDIWAFHTQLGEVTDLCRSFPDLTVILDHAGGPLGVGPYAGRRDEVFEVWKREMETLSRDFAGRIGAKVRRVTVRDTASRWGSCSANQSLSYCWRLILAPAFVLEYVVAHEVAHLREMNHGPRFWRLVRSLVADIEAPQAWLRKNGTALHRYGA